MRITVMTPDEQFLTLDVDLDESVENLKALLEVEAGRLCFYALLASSFFWIATSAALPRQRLVFNGNELTNSQRLSAVGVRDGDLVTMDLKSPRAPSNDLSFNPDGSAVNPAAFQQYFRQDSSRMAQMQQNDPWLAQAVLGNDLEKLQSFLREHHLQRLEYKKRQDEELALLYADPFDVEAQKKIEEAIRQKDVDENWEAAIEHNPEAFAHVVMLYVDMEVNGVPIKAFVDSGAQSTIISKSCAERCGLLRLLDQRYQSIVQGVGQSKTLGKIHVAPIKIGNVFYHCSFTVLESPNMEFLFGLDMLRKHQCTIDLKDNVLRVGGGEVSVPFLQEKDIPSRLLHEQVFNDEIAQGSASIPGTSEIRENDGKPTSGVAGNVPQKSEFESKVSKLVELGFSRDAVIQALTLFNGNEEQAAGFLFGG